MEFPEFDDVIMDDVIEQEPVETDAPDGNVEHPVLVDDAAVATFNTLRDKGIIPVGEDIKVSNWEELDEYITDIPKMVMENIVSTAPSEAQQLIKYAFAKGDSMTKEDLKEFINLYLEDSSEIAVDNVDDARLLLSKVYKEQGLRQSVINATLDALEDDGEDILLEEAKKYSKTSNAETKIKEVEASNLAQIESQKKYYSDFSTEVEQLTLSTQRKKLIQEEMVKGITNEKLNSVIADPKAITQLVNFLSYYDNKTKSFDFKDFVNQTFSKKGEEMKTNIVKDHFSSIKHTSERSMPKSSKYKFDDLTPLD
jgi:hypothetical protein